MLRGGAVIAASRECCLSRLYVRETWAALLRVEVVADDGDASRDGKARQGKRDRVRMHMTLTLETPGIDPTLHRSISKMPATAAPLLSFAPAMAHRAPDLGRASCAVLSVLPTAPRVLS